MHRTDIFSHSETRSDRGGPIRSLALHMSIRHRDLRRLRIWYLQLSLSAQRIASSLEQTITIHRPWLHIYQSCVGPDTAGGLES